MFCTSNFSVIFKFSICVLHTKCLKNNLTAKNLMLTLERSLESCTVYAVMTKWVSLSVEPAGKNWSSVWKWCVKVQSNDAIFHPIFSFNLLSTKIILFDPLKSENLLKISLCPIVWSIFWWNSWRHNDLTCSINLNCLIKLFVKSCCVTTSTIDSSRWASWFKIGWKIVLCECTFIVHPLCS